MNTSEYINTTSREYSTYVMEQRAIPTITDGLKLSQRIALHLLRHQDKPVKTAGLVGRMLESGLYVHGDQSAGDAISRLAAPFLNNYPLIRGEGAFGTRTAPVDGIGAPRYTEVLRSKIAEKELYIDLDICPQRENYDGSKLMPQTFLPRLPLILLNGSTGIAIGFASKILPRSIDELREAVVEVLETGATTKPLMPFYERYDCEIIRDHSNPGKFMIRGKVDIVNTTTVRIKEIPPGTSLEYVNERLIELTDSGVVKSFSDNSTDKIDITIKMPRAEVAKYDTEDKLLVLFKLVQTETENLTVLDPSGKRVIKYKNAQDMVKDFVEWRLGLYEDRYALLLDKEQDVTLFWESFLSCFNAGDGKRSVAASISGIKSKSELRDRVESAIEGNGLEVRGEIVSRIVDYPVYKFTKEGYTEALAKLKDSKKSAKEYADILKSPKKRKSVYKKEVQL